MSKQIYIDSDGNEIQVSGTVNTADMMPMSGNDSTKVSEAIGDLSDLTTTDKSSLVRAINEIASYTRVYGNTASGAIATFDTSLALPLQDCTIAINAVQEGSGTPSPDNVRPITGFTGANIHVADDENPHVIDNVTVISWNDEAGTVYGGSLDVTTGLLTVTWAYIDTWTNVNFTFNGSTATYTEVRCALSNAKAYGTSNMKSNKLETGPADLYKINGRANTEYIHFDVPLCANAVEAKQWIIDNGIAVIYELATPVTYQLTPTQISAIVGTNNVFTDTNGNTSVVYACSLKDYIDRQ